jgi:serine/threonine protein kinase
VHVLREALRGLDYAHRRVDDEGRPLGIVHRDVSPSNLLVSFDGEVKVCDFGIARANDMLGGGSSAHELSEAIKGKAGYMSPEHASGQPIDARADVFAAGVVLWELAAGRRLYRAGEGRDSLVEQARRAEIPELPAQGLPDPEKLRAIVSKALARDRGDRYVSAAAMLRDLEGYAASARLMTSPLALGDWLEKTFGADILAKRRTRERAMAALDRGAPVVVQAIAATPPPPRSSHPPLDDYRIDVEPPSTGMLPVSPSPVPPAVMMMTPPARRRVWVIVLVVFLVLAVIFVGGAVAAVLALRTR